MPRRATKKSRREYDSSDSDDDVDDESVLYFIPSEGTINIDVLVHYLREYLGHDSDAEPGAHPKNSERVGYFVKSRLGLSVAMMKDLKHDTSAWEREHDSGRKMRRITYKESITWERRRQSGPSGQHLILPSGQHSILRRGRRDTPPPPFPDPRLPQNARDPNSAARHADHKLSTSMRDDLREQTAGRLGEKLCEVSKNETATQPSSVLPPLPAVSSLPHKTTISPFKRLGMLQDLPLWIGGKQKKRFEAIPDTGATLNILNSRVLRDLSSDAISSQKDYDDVQASKITLEMADGHSIQTIGQVTLICSFLDCPHTTLTILFHICDTLAESIRILVGKEFLETTKTLTSFAHRLTERHSLLGIPRVMRLSSTTPMARSQLRILMNSTLVLACPDTGSEIDLIRNAFAQKLHSQIEPLNSQDPQRVQYADGSLGMLLGKLEATVSIPARKKKKMRLRSSAVVVSDDEDSDSMNNELAINRKINRGSGNTARTLSPQRTFYLVDALSSDVVLGQAFLYSVDAYNSHRHAFLEADSPGYEHALRGIFVVSEIQNRWVNFWKKYGGAHGIAPALPATELELEAALNTVDRKFITSKRKIEDELRQTTDSRRIKSLQDGKRDLELDYFEDCESIRNDFDNLTAARIAQNVPARAVPSKRSQEGFSRFPRLRRRLN